VRAGFEAYTALLGDAVEVELDIRLLQPN